MTITFCGHSQFVIDYKIRGILEEVLIGLIENGAKDFLLDGYGIFDSVAADIVYELKKTYPHIRSTLVVPYINSKKYSNRYDDTVYPPIENVPPRFAIIKRNEWMVEQSDVVISYVDFEAGGAARTLKYAKRKHKKIIDLCRMANRLV